MDTFPDNTFRPNLPVTRGQFADILVTAFPDVPEVRRYLEGAFNDIPAGYWATSAIRQSFATNFLSGYPDRIFAPLQYIPRSQVVVAIASGFNLYQPTLPADFILAGYFNDIDAIPGYAKDIIAAAAENELVVNFPQIRELRPNALATRGEIAAFLCKTMDASGLIPPQYVVEESKFIPPPDEFLDELSEVENQENNLNAGKQFEDRKKNANFSVMRSLKSSSFLPISFFKQPDRNSDSELRGVWLTNIDSDVLFSRQNLETAISRLQELNFNTLYPTVWNGGYTLYPSQIMESEIGSDRDPEPGLQERDMLAEAIAIAHAKNMRAIPWFEFGFMLPADSEIAQKHPDWLTERINGDKIWLEGGVRERVWLNPLHPEVQKFITRLIVEIVENYDIDGIQMDDHFGYPSDFGYDDYTVKLYRQEHDGYFPANDYKNFEWIRWRADKITEYMKSLFFAIKASKNNVLVSLSPNPQEFSLESYLLDWQTWERMGLIEELVVQLYRTDFNKFRQDLSHTSIQQAKTHIPVGIGVLTGLRRRFVPFDRIQKQVNEVRKNNLAGVSFFFYESLWNYTDEPRSRRQEGFKRLFNRPKNAPNLDNFKVLSLI
ncbi:MAG: family 10 glycosylhydrolase [Cyanobacteria bacterium SBLK]|nr:family 10 glycosylhydrolase [Cyanobacteria bacterium SBLK]